MILQQHDQGFSIIMSFVSASSWKECWTKSRRCKNSNIASEQFNCHMKGHFPHPSNISVFLRCHDPGYKACICTCKYQKMCFDVKKKVCQFEYLDDMIDCSRPLQAVHLTSISHSHFKTGSIQTVLNEIESFREDPQNVSKVSAVNNDNNSELINQGMKSKDKGMSEEFIPGRLHEHTLVHKNPNGKPGSSQLQRTTITARQIAKPVKLLVHDHSSFPTWAVALVVLCIVILLVLIVMFMY